MSQYCPQPMFTQVIECIKKKGFLRRLALIFYSTFLMECTIKVTTTSMAKTIKTPITTGLF